MKVIVIEVQRDFKREDLERVLCNMQKNEEEVFTYDEVENIIEKENNNKNP